MNPYDSLPKRKRRIALWWIGLLVLIILVRVVALVGRSEQTAADVDDSQPSGLEWVVVVVATLAFVALIFGLVFWSTRLSARRRLRRLAAERPSAAVFLTARGPELQQRLSALGLGGARLVDRMGVTVDRYGVTLWGMNPSRGPIVTLQRDYLAGLTATMGETGTSARTFTGPAVGVVARVGGGPGLPATELVVPIAIYGPTGLGFAKRDYAWQVLQDAAQFIPLKAVAPAAAHVAVPAQAVARQPLQQPLPPLPQPPQPPYPGA